MIVVVDYGVGNLGSIVNMFKKVGAKAVASSDPAVIKDAEKLILPGVGAFDAAMRKFHETGLVPVVGELVLEKKIPVLGLCVGLQLMTKGSEEDEKQAWAGSMQRPSVSSSMVRMPISKFRTWVGMKRMWCVNIRSWQIGTPSHAFILSTHIM